MAEDPLYIDARAMIENAPGAEAVGIAMDLVALIWWPTKQPFEFDAEILAAQLDSLLPARGYSSETLARNREAIRSFFTELPNRMWVPNPVYFSVTNGNPGSAS